MPILAFLSFDITGSIFACGSRDSRSPIKQLLAKTGGSPQRRYLQIMTKPAIGVEKKVSDVQSVDAPISHFPVQF